MRYIGNLKLGQLTKLFSLFKGSVIPSLKIFGQTQSRLIEFQTFERFEVLENR
jgi:hypothetical protein